MSIRVIAGTAKGFSLEVPKGRRVRPSLDRVREALFSSLMGRIEGSWFLDLFAGTGANGIEALSRGAATCTFVEANRSVLQVLRRNIEKTGLVSRADVLEATLPRDLDKLSEPYDIIFADPPHNFNDYRGLVSKIADCGLLRDGGVIVLEHPESVHFGEGLASHRLDHESRYGKTRLSFLA